jgi:serine/threonine protein kinase
MALSAGAKLGRYEILAPIGKGGMGEVWKARDTRLNRTVAIKRLAEKHSARFEQEARAIAALNHPHICTLHDIGPDCSETTTAGTGPTTLSFDYGTPAYDRTPILNAILRGAMGDRVKRPGVR